MPRTKPLMKTLPMFSSLAPPLFDVEEEEAAAPVPVPVPVPVPEVFPVAVAATLAPVFFPVPVPVTLAPCPLEIGVAVTTAEVASIDPVATPASALKAAGVIVLKYPGNSLRV